MPTDWEHGANNQPISDLKCEKGKYYSDSEQSCLRCNNDTYKDIEGDQNCTQCPVTAKGFATGTDNRGSQDESDCKTSEKDLI